MNTTLLIPKESEGAKCSKFRFQVKFEGEKKKKKLEDLSGINTT